MVSYQSRWFICSQKFRFSDQRKTPQLRTGLCPNKKIRYTAHQIGGKKSLALSLMKLCTGSELQKPSLSAFSVPLADSALERRNHNLFRRLP